MDFLQYSEFLLRKIRERQQTLSRTLSTGSAQDYAQYQRLVGEISGLNFTEQEIVNLHANLEDEDNE
jgi:hypothetical protein|tara:strand:- start:32 stop:232 length:201 start_codon:yes stop_codon:yes gene_type:complete